MLDPRIEDSPLVEVGVKTLHHPLRVACTKNNQSIRAEGIVMAENPSSKQFLQSSVGKLLKG